MEEIVLVSDNHGQRKPLEYLKENYPVTDYFIHCGDSEMHPNQLSGFTSVQGNNDFFHAYPNERIITIENHNILVVHCHMHMIFNQPQQLARYAKKVHCDIVFYGHTHIPQDITVNGVRCINPGSIWHNRDGTKPSYMIIHLDGKISKLRRKNTNFKKILKNLTKRLVKFLTLWYI